MKKIALILISIICFSTSFIQAQTQSCLDVMNYMNMNSSDWDAEHLINYLKDNKDKFDFNIEEDHWLYNFSLARIYYLTDNYKEALDYLSFVNEYSLIHAEELIRDGSANLLLTFYWEANSLFYTGADKETVLSKLEATKGIYERCGLNDTEVYTQIIKDIKELNAGTYEAIQLTPTALQNVLEGKYEDAIPQLESILSFLIPSGDVEKYAPFIQALGNCYVSLGRLSDAEAIYLDTIKKMNELGTYDYEAYRNIADALGVLYGQVHNYREGKHYSMLSKQLHEKNLDFDDSYVRCLSNLAILENGIGNLYLAKIYIDVALKYMRKNIGLVTANDLISSMENIAPIANYDIESNSIKDSAERALQLRPMIQFLSNAAIIYQQAGFWNESIKSLEESIALGEDIGEPNPLAYNNLGTLYLIQGKFDESLPYFDKAASLCNNPYIISEILFNQALVLWLLDSSKTLNAAIDAANAIKINVEDCFIFLSEAERANFWKHFEFYLPFLNLMIYDTSSPDSYGEIYDNILTAKGLLLRSSQGVRNAILNSGSQDIIDDFNRLMAIRQQILSETDQNNYSKLKQEAEDIDKRLSRAASSYSNFIKQNNISWKDIKSKLNDNDIAIEFYNIPVIESAEVLQNYDGYPRYAAVILKKGYDHPHIVTLCTEEQISSIEKGKLYTSDSLFNLIWKPLQNELVGVQNIYFSPDRELHNIAIEYAVTPDNKLVRDKYNIFRLSSTRELLDNNSSSLGNTVLYGGLDYDMDADSLIAMVRASEHPKEYASRASDIRGIRYGVYNLPETLNEVNEISRLFPNSKVKVVVGANGTEESFRDLQEQDIDIVHLSTHGFFWDGNEANNLDYIKFINTSLQQSSNDEDLALSLSGLFFSGANIALSGQPLPNDIEDGILTAKEISNMNLDNVNLVVLSACQTGLGETTREGVFGLQRGFKLAGAKSLLMSLWDVDDEATKILMVEFYKHLLSGKPKVESLSLAQSHIMKTPGFGHHKYWAAWILLDALN